MIALIVYDSQYGNTEQIARAMGEAIGGEVRQAGKNVGIRRINV